MYRFVMAFVALLALSLSPSVAEAQIPDCWNCHACAGSPSEYDVSYEGASTVRIDVPFAGCVRRDWCAGCDPNEEEDSDAELALTELIESDGENLIDWMKEYRTDFSVTVVGSALQISRTCGQAITWLPLRESETVTITELLQQ